MDRPDCQGIVIVEGIPEGLLAAAAALYDEAFRRKLQPFARSSEVAAVLTSCVDPTVALAALDDGRLVGIAALQDHERRFCWPRLARIASQVRWWRAPLLWLVFGGMFARHARRDELYVDALAVGAQDRDRGIGTCLLEAVCDLALRRGLARVSLTVVDTNPRARQLYERMGFVTVRTRRYPLLRSLMGLTAVSTMVRQVDAQKPGG